MELLFVWFPWLPSPGWKAQTPRSTKTAARGWKTRRLPAHGFSTSKACAVGTSAASGATAPPLQLCGILGSRGHPGQSEPPVLTLQGEQAWETRCDFVQHHGNGGKKSWEEFRNFNSFAPKFSTQPHRPQLVPAAATCRSPAVFSGPCLRAAKEPSSARCSEHQTDPQSEQHSPCTLHAKAKAPLPSDENHLDLPSSLVSSHSSTVQASAF